MKSANAKPKNFVEQMKSMQARSAGAEPQRAQAGPLRAFGWGAPIVKPSQGVNQNFSNVTKQAPRPAGASLPPPSLTLPEVRDMVTQVRKAKTRPAKKGAR